MFKRRGRSKTKINVVFTDALNMADNHILIKNAAKEIAFKHNKAVTFMAKYNKDVCGSSCHIHNSFFDKKTKKMYSTILKINMECLTLLKAMLLVR